MLNLDRFTDLTYYLPSMCLRWVKGHEEILSSDSLPPSIWIKSGEWMNLINNISKYWPLIKTTFIIMLINDIILSFIAYDKEVLNNVFCLNRITN